jgi:phosphatidate cytidylyltransferase
VLKTRVLTALIILPVTLAVVFLAPPLVFRGIIAILMLAGAREYGRIADLSPSARRTLLILQALLFAGLFLAWDRAAALALPLLAAACFAWLALFLRLPPYRDDARPDANFRRLGFVSALLALTSCWFALGWLHDREGGPFVVFLLLLIIWSSDTGAYFAGRQFGKRKLARVISPNKTWEGVYGGVALALLVAWLWSGPVMQAYPPLAALALTTVVTAFASIGGDLYISLHKRTVKLDDTGTLLPGHGGVLDRYDSLLSGAPFFALAFGWLIA